MMNGMINRLFLRLARSAMESEATGDRDDCQTRENWSERWRESHVKEQASAPCSRDCVVQQIELRGTALAKPQLRLRIEKCIR